MDATLGLGGHAARVLEAGGEGMRLIGIDRDPGALEEASRRLNRFGERVSLICGNFRNVAGLLQGVTVDGFLLDLGLSSFQIADRTRGFSYQEDGPLDMAMGEDGRSVRKLLAEAPEREIQDILSRFGEERRSRTIARNIVRNRERGEIYRTSQLRSIIEKSVPSKNLISSLSRVFQALRIWANEELGSLEEFLPQAVGMLGRGGRIVAMSYHSLEDRIVKNFFRREEKGCICPDDFPRCDCGRSPSLKILTKRPVKPSPLEVEENPRSRSARLRAAERL